MNIIRAVAQTPQPVISRIRSMDWVMVDAFHLAGRWCETVSEPTLVAEAASFAQEVPCCPSHSGVNSFGGHGRGVRSPVLFDHTGGPKRPPVTPGATSRREIATSDRALFKIL
jgi:hypothetical protein